MGQLRLYAIGIDEVRGLIGAPPAERERLRTLAHRLLAPEPGTAQTRRQSRLGPIFRRPPAAPVVSPDTPLPEDLEVLLAGAYVPAGRLVATWRVLEALAQGTAWGWTTLDLAPAALDELDFALACGGVPAAMGLRQLLDVPAEVPLLAVPGLTVGWHPHEVALAMAEAYREALTRLEIPGQVELVSGLVGWLDGFAPWGCQAFGQRRPIPDLVGFWAS